MFCVFISIGVRKWSEEQKRAIMTLMEKLIQEQKPPRKPEILELQCKFPCLNSRPWKDIKFMAWSMVQQRQKKRQKTINKLFKK
jgi:hypothetical protein